MPEVDMTDQAGDTGQKVSPTFAQAVSANLATPGSDPGSTAGTKAPALTDIHLNGWKPFSETMTNFGVALKAYVEQHNTPESTHMLQMFNIMELGFTSFSNGQYEAFKILDDERLKNQQTHTIAENTQAMVHHNVVCGNIADKVESTAKYGKVVKDVQEGQVTSKVLEMNFEKELTSKEAIVQKAKTLLSKNKHMKASMNKVAKIIPLGKKTTLTKGDKPFYTIPVLLKSKTRDDKADLDFNLKKSKFKTAFHWPGQIVKPINDLRDLYSKHKDDNINLTDKYIMLRPNYETGRSVNVYYREKTKDAKFKYLESIRTPAEYELCRQLGINQPCVSKYVTLAVPEEEK